MLGIAGGAKKKNSTGKRPVSEKAPLKILF